RQATDVDNLTVAPVRRGFAARRQEDRAISLLQTADKCRQRLCRGMGALQGIDERFDVIEYQQGTDMNASLQNGSLQVGGGIVVGRIYPIEAGQLVGETSGKLLVDEQLVFRIEAGKGF